MAERLGQTKVAKLLSQTLSEEEKTDALLTQLSPPLLEQATQEGADEEEEQPSRSRSSRGRAARA
jgi:ferritin-like metal-binding protein YciE